MNGIIEVSDNLGLTYQYVTITLEEDALCFTQHHLFYQGQKVRLPLNKMENIVFTRKQNRKTVRFTCYNLDYLIVENATLSLSALAEFIHCASFAYNEDYVPLPKDFHSF